MTDKTTDKMKTSRESTPADPVPEPASDRKSAAKPVQALALAETRKTETVDAETRGSDRSSMWKTLQQLKGVLPYLSRLLPLLDARILPLLDLVGLGHAQNSGLSLSLSKELREDVTSIQGGQNDIRLALQDQSLEIKRLEDEIALLRQAAEKNAVEHARLVEDVKSVAAWVRATGAGLAILLLVLIVMVGVLLMHGTR
jgi:hypothetical protein